MSIAAWRSPDRGRAHRRLLVATSPVRDLLIRAKHLFVAAKVAGIHRTEIDRSATHARLISGSSRVGPVQPPGYPAQGYPARLRLSVPKISRTKNPEGQRFAVALLAKSLRLFCFLAGDHYGKGKSLRDER